LSLNNNVCAFVVTQLCGGFAYFILSAQGVFEAIPALSEEAAFAL
jgi:hypothetical protein